MDRYNLYKQLKDKGFPQGGSGSFLVDPKTDERVYIPKVEEILTQYVGDPKDWDKMVEAMTRVWIDNKK